MPARGGSPSSQTWFSFSSNHTYTLPTQMQSAATKAVQPEVISRAQTGNIKMSRPDRHLNLFILVQTSDQSASSNGLSQNSSEVWAAASKSFKDSSSSVTGSKYSAG